jgi:hypothetical protein
VYLDDRWAVNAIIQVVNFNLTVVEQIPGLSKHFEIRYKYLRSNKLGLLLEKKNLGSKVGSLYS